MVENQKTDQEYDPNAAAESAPEHEDASIDEPHDASHAQEPLSGRAHERDTEAEAGLGRDEEIGRLQDALLRTRAEMDNLHKRSEREVEKSRKFAVESLLRDLVPVIDTLDQGIEAAGDTGAEGLALTRRMMLATLKRFGLEVLDPEGETFDPQWHEAMSMVPSEDHASQQIISVLQRGYRLHDRVVRAARVIVAK